MNQMTNLPPPIFTSAGGKGGGAIPPPEWRAPDPTPEFVEAWRAIMQRKWSIALLGVLAAVIAGFVVTQLKPTYRSSATVLLESASTKVVSQIEDVYSGVSNNR